MSKGKLYGLISRPAVGFNLEKHGSHLGRQGWTPRPELGTTADSHGYDLWRRIVDEPTSMFALVEVKS